MNTMNTTTTTQWAYKFRLYPTKEQENLLRRTIGCCRKIYNMALEYRMTAWYQRQEKVSYADTSKLLKEWKRDSQYFYLKEVSSVPLQQALRHLQSAYSRFFDHVSAYPVFKQKKNGGSASFMRTAFKWDGKNITLAKMDKPLPIRWSRTLPKRCYPSSVTVSLDAAGRWFVSILVEECIKHLPPSTKEIGVDLGVVDFAITSDGDKIANPRHFDQLSYKLAKAQKQLARKEKGSNNYKKARAKVARVYAKIRDTRQDFLHKTSTQLIRDNQTIVLEDLKVKQMTKKIEPIEDPNNPGHYLPNGRGKQKKSNKNILDCSWRAFRTMLEYKAAWYGRQVIIIDQWYPSTQICSSCGKRTGKKDTKIRKWTCPYCHAEHDRDINAAKNILSAGRAVRACGDIRLQNVTVR